ncbi:MAG TPA: GIY-YIG nuclease family protein [Pelagibacteraceae bacterium]|jgi:putative endonuclease|nr:GIY-YIG nuclease family protein [Pelagibacterales bacterium]HIM32817.1 GIY-YIG nuclease family protein [Pelagibacteraceae bacterium]
MSYFVYVIGSLKNSRPKTYVGWTKDLNERLRKHNSGKGAKSTKGRKWKIIYHEIFNSKEKALKREYYLKKDRIFRKELRDKI